MTQIFYPHQVLGAEFGEFEIGWQKSYTSNQGYLLDSRWRTEKDLTHFANPASGDLRTRTQALYCLDFRIANLPEVITGIKLNLKTQRNGRVVDEQIQLVYRGETIGNNNFIYITDEEGHLKITNDTDYGSETDTWGAELTPEMLQDPSFGVILKFQAHPYYPHRSTMYLDAVSLTVY
jgi:hypothetical protein